MAMKIFALNKIKCFVTHAQETKKHNAAPTSGHGHDGLNHSLCGSGGMTNDHRWIVVSMRLCLDHFLTGVCREKQRNKRSKKVHHIMFLSSINVPLASFCAASDSLHCFLIISI
jgi:hypothetical protein